MEYFLELVLLPLKHDFMVRAILVSVVVGVVCGLLSNFLLLKRWSLLGDAVSHSVLPGVVIAFMIGIPFSVGAFIFGLLGVLSIGWIKRRTLLGDDAIIGIVYTSLLALGLVLVSRVSSNIDLMHILFGYVLGISNFDSTMVMFLAGLVFTTVLVLRKHFLVYAFDSAHAQAINMNVKLYHYLLLVLLAITVVASVQTVGVVMVVAMLITPAAIGRLWTSHFENMLKISVSVNVVSCVIGAYLSYYLNVSTGGAMVLVLSSIFGISFVIKQLFKKMV